MRKSALGGESWAEIGFEEAVRELPRRGSIQQKHYKAAGRFPVIDQGAEFIAGYTEDEDQVVHDGLPLVVFGDHTRSFKYVDFPFAPGADGTKLLSAREPVVEPLFLFFALLNLRLPNKGYNRHFKYLRESTLLAPRDLREQRAIAGVLSKIQSTVQVQEKIVAGLRELKAATMAKLFREGLRGERRKQTEIGEIPKSWEVVPLGELARIGNGSTPRKTEPAYWEGGTLPWLTSAKVHEGVITAADQFVTARAQQECHLPLVPGGSIVIAITGEGRTLGNAALVRIGTFVSQHLAFVALTSGRMSSEFLLAYLQSRYEDLRKSGSGGGTTKAALTCGFLSRYLVPVPPLSDQHVIGELRSKLDVRLTQASLRLEALRTLFSSTLHLLMTGQVRVPVGKEV